MATTYPKKSIVLFRKAFAYEGADNITHITLDGLKTACGRKEWATEEGWPPVDGPDCLTCRVAWRKLPESEQQAKSPVGPPTAEVIIETEGA